jgi:hypothetical protein
MCLDAGTIGHMVESVITTGGLIAVAYFQRSIHRDVGSNLTAVKHVADTFAGEVARLNEPGATPTPIGNPSPEHPVVLSAGVPVVARPRKLL